MLGAEVSGHTCKYHVFGVCFDSLKPILSAFCIVPNHSTGVSNLLSGMSQGHRREQLTQTLILRLLKTHLFTPIPDLQELKHNKIGLVTRPDLHTLHV